MALLADIHRLSMEKFCCAFHVFYFFFDFAFGLCAFDDIERRATKIEDSMTKGKLILNF